MDRMTSASREIAQVLRKKITARTIEPDSCRPLRRPALPHSTAVRSLRSNDEVRGPVIFIGGPSEQSCEQEWSKQAHARERQKNASMLTRSHSRLLPFFQARIEHWHPQK